MPSIFRSQTIQGKFLECGIVFAACAGLLLTFTEWNWPGTKPAGFVQILPRGSIAAINEPTYVASDRAKVAEDSIVLGVLVDGVPIAYSLNLLNRHEVVNDSVGDTNFAAVW